MEHQAKMYVAGVNDVDVKKAVNASGVATTQDVTSSTPVKPCPTCPKPQSMSIGSNDTVTKQSLSERGFKRYYGGMFDRIEDTLVEYIRRNNTVQRDSCIECVKKHVGYAKRLIEESKTLTSSDKGSILMNHLDTIGELRAATDEASAYTELHDLLLSSERAYRYYGATPDWDAIVNLMLQYGATVPNT